MAKPMTAKYKGVCKYELCDGDRRIEAGEPVKWLGKGNGVMHWDCAVECGADAIVVKVVAGETITYNPPTPTGEKVKCDEGCGGTGQFITKIVNGTPQGPGGIHFRCNGKGYQTDADRIRNYWYELCDDDRRIQPGEEVKWLGKGNGVMHWACAVECGADQIVVEKVGGETVQYNPPKPTGEVLVCDEGCGGTGQFITKIVNGTPQGPGGIHFRCQGKGTQNDKDRIRNYWYDVMFRKVYV